MAWLPIAQTVPQYGVNTLPAVGYVLKFYASGTNTNIPLATDSTGGTTATDVVLDAQGYPSLSGSIFIPHIDQTYKLALYPSQSAADSDTGAVWTQDNLNAAITSDTASQVLVSSNDTTTGYLNGKLVAGSGVSLTEIDDGANETLKIDTPDKNYTTLALMVADVANLTIGDSATLKERTTGNGGGGIWDVIAKTTENGFNIVAGDATRSFQLRLSSIPSTEFTLYPDQWGCVGDGSTDNALPGQAVFDYLDGTGTGGVIDFSGGIYNTSVGWTYQQTGTSDINPGIKITGSGRRTTTLNYTGTTGFLLSIQGATGAAVAATGRNGLTEGITLQSIGLTGTGVLSGNTDSGVYVQGFNHFLMDDCLINGFPQDGIHLDRLYYALAPDATLDDRGAFVTLRHSEISECGRTGLQAGGINSSTDYSIDHLYTENLHITANDGTAAKIYTQNWTDVGSLFYGDDICVYLYAQNTDILTQTVTMIGSRFEGGQTDCMLKIDSCLSGYFLNCFFPGHAGPLPASQIKVATSASTNVGNLTFDTCIHQNATSVYDVVGTGGVNNVTIKNPRFASITNEVSNTASKPVQMIKGNVYERVTGGSEPVSLTGVAGDSLTSILAGDSADWFKLNNSAKTITLGNGTGTNDLTIKKLGAGIATFSGPIGVGNANLSTTGVSTITASIEVFDAAGTSLGHVPVYTTAT